MDLSAPVSFYCERLGPGLFAEPLNAISNFAFLGASAWCWQHLGERGPWYARALAAWIAVVGLASLSFHTFANTGTDILDVLSIAVFIYGYVACFFRRHAGWAWPAALLAMPLFWLFGLGVTAWFPPQAFNGSIGYLPALAGLMAMAAWLGLRGDPAARWLAGAAALFALSLSLRSVDRAWCTRLPIGTHCLWHCLNAGVLGLVTISLAPAPSSTTGVSR